MTKEVMNKRIKELAEQASHQSPDGYLVTIPYSNDFVKKFAKLIIKELINVISESREVRQTAYYYRNRLAEHFGVEEALKQEQEQEYEVLAGIGKGVEIPAGWKYYYIKPKLPLQQKQEQDEPVAYVNDQYSRDGYNDEISKLLPVGTYLYTTPQTKEWVGLNGADWNDFNPLKSNDPHRVADWVEKLLKERNT